MVGLEGLVNGSGEVSLEDVEGFSVGLAVLDSAFDELLCGLVVTGLGERGPVDRGVQLPIASA